MSEVAQLEAVVSIASSWRTLGHCQPLSSRVHAMCQIPECSCLVFVSVRTNDGIRSLCLKHFAAICEQGRELCNDCVRRRWCQIARARPGWLPIAGA